jgi:hypothetical protein
MLAEVIEIAVTVNTAVVTGVPAVAELLVTVSAVAELLVTVPEVADVLVAVLLVMVPEVAVPAKIVVVLVGTASVT